MEKIDKYRVCPYVTVQKLLSGKWSMYIMYVLQKGPIRFNELLRQMPEEMTHTTLSRQLKRLEKEGLIIRHVYPQVPPKVEYFLSPIGEGFGKVVDSMGEWGKNYIKYLKETDAMHSSTPKKEEI